MSSAIRSTPVETLLQKRKRLRRELLPNATSKLRIAVLGGVTTNEVVDLLDLLLLEAGFETEFYQSEYNKYYEDAMLEPEKLTSFRPDIVYVHTHYKNLQRVPNPATSEAEYQDLLSAELARFQAIWKSLSDNVGCQIIQNNFELPPLRVLGSLDSVAPGGLTRFVNDLNAAFARSSAGDRNLLIQDLHAIAAMVGGTHFHDWSRWYSYKMLTTPEGSFAIAGSLATTISVMKGKTKKCLVLDLDNTLWGGVIGDDGLDKIQIGRETAVAEAHTAFQEYCLALRDRGILLAVCSKNEPDIARSGFTHPDSILKLEHFSSFQANWEPKHENIRKIAQELNIGLDSLVFVDDNPAERAIVAAQVPEVTVPDVGNEVAYFPAILQAGNYFETVALSKEDLSRAETYAANSARASQAARFANYGEYLDSLDMTRKLTDSLRFIWIGSLN